MAYAMVAPLVIMDHIFLLSEGFSICFLAAQSYLCHPSNLKEYELRRVLGPFENPPIPNCRLLNCTRLPFG